MYNNELSKEQLMKYLIKRNINYQKDASYNLKNIENNIKFQNPHWNNTFVKNYIISRYPDYWFYNEKLQKSYHNLTIEMRYKYRLYMVLQNHIPLDVIRYTEQFLTNNY